MATRGRDRVDYVPYGYPEEQVGGVIPYGELAGGFTRPPSVSPFMGPSEQLTSPFTWQSFLDSLKGGRAKGSQARLPSNVPSIIPGAGGTPSLPSTYIPESTGYPEEDIGAGAGLYPAYEEVSLATPEAIEEIKKKSKDAAPPGQESELRDIINRAFVGAHSAADASAIFAMDQEYDNQIKAIIDDPKSYIGGNIEGELTARAQNQVNILTARQTALRDIQDELTIYNTAAQTQALEQQETARTAEQGRALTQLISSQFPGLIPEGAQISPANMNVLLQLATLKSQQEQIESQRQDTLAQRQRSTSLARELFPEMDLGDVSVGPGELGMLLQIAQYRQQQRERGMAGRGSDVTIYRGFEGE